MALDGDNSIYSYMYGILLPGQFVVGVIYGIDDI